MRQITCEIHGVFGTDSDFFHFAKSIKQAVAWIKGSVEK